VEAMGHAWEFLVVTSDRDLGDAVPYAGVRRDTWLAQGPAKVWYASGGWRDVARLVRDTHADVLYLNSFFDARFSIAALRAARRHPVESRRIVLAPRGEFSPGALRLKAFKKRLYLAWAKRSALYRGLTWHASTPLEADEIRRALGDVAADVRVAPDLVLPTPALDEGAHGPPKSRRPLRIAFVSRLSPKKNLPFALEALRPVTVPVEFDIYGPAEDQAHVALCRTLAARLPANVQVRFHGAIEHGEVGRVLGASHLFFLPTLGENFGHVIAEALGAGTPVLVSDRTPWRSLAERGAGWDLPLDDPAAFSRSIEALAAVDDERYRAMRAAARRHAGTVAPAVTNDQLMRLFFGPADAPHPPPGRSAREVPREAAKS